MYVITKGNTGGTNEREVVETMTEKLPKIKNGRLPRDQMKCATASKMGSRVRKANGTEHRFFAKRRGKKCA